MYEAPGSTRVPCKPDMVSMYVRWHRPAILAYRRLRPKGQKSQTRLSHTARTYFITTILTKISHHLGAGSGTASESVCELRLDCQVSGSCLHLSSAGHSQGDTRLRLRVLSVMEVGFREAI